MSSSYSNYIYPFIPTQPLIAYTHAFRSDLVLQPLYHTSSYTHPPTYAPTYLPPPPPQPADNIMWRTLETMRRIEREATPQTYYYPSSRISDPHPESRQNFHSDVGGQCQLSG